MRWGECKSRALGLLAVADGHCARGPRSFDAALVPAGVRRLEPVEVGLGGVGVDHLRGRVIVRSVDLDSLVRERSGPVGPVGLSSVAAGSP
jgi:hypothetical protein